MTLQQSPKVPNEERDKGIAHQKFVSHGRAVNEEYYLDVMK